MGIGGYDFECKYVEVCGLGGLGLIPGLGCKVSFFSFFFFWGGGGGQACKDYGLKKTQGQKNGDKKTCTPNNEEYTIMPIV